MMLTGSLGIALRALQNPLLAAANASSNNADDDKLSDYIPDSRDLSMSRAVSISERVLVATRATLMCSEASVAC